MKKDKRHPKSRGSEDADPIDLLEAVFPLSAGLTLITSHPFSVRVRQALPHAESYFSHPLDHLIGFAFFVGVAGLGVSLILSRRRGEFPESLRGMFGGLLLIIGFAGLMTEFVASIDPVHLNNEARGFFN
jgi:hypothetical protein